MRLIHISDTHGGFPRLYGKFDAVLHTGDFFPNSQHLISNNKPMEAVFQLKWLQDHLHEIKVWLNGRPLIFVLGNHDFIHSELMEITLDTAGIEAIDLTDKIVNINEVNFYGFPYVPYINGGWNYERELPEMQEEIDKMLEKLNQTYVDVLACHAPMYKCLDLSYSNQLLGNALMNTAIDYKLQKELVPRYYLHGHLHESSGITIRNDMLVSNAATTFHVIELF